jgi:hypothetical protein
VEAVSDSLMMLDTGNEEQNSAVCSYGLVNDTGVRKMNLSFHFPPICFFFWLSIFSIFLILSRYHPPLILQFLYEGLP